MTLVMGKTLFVFICPVVTILMRSILFVCIITTTICRFFRYQEKQKCSILQWAVIIKLENSCFFFTLQLNIPIGKNTMQY